MGDAIPLLALAGDGQLSALAGPCNGVGCIILVGSGTDGCAGAQNNHNQVCFGKGGVSLVGSLGLVLGVSLNVGLDGSLSLGLNGGESLGLGYACGLGSGGLLVEGSQRILVGLIACIATSNGAKQHQSGGQDGENLLVHIGYPPFWIWLFFYNINYNTMSEDCQYAAVKSRLDFVNLS